MSDSLKDSLIKFCRLRLGMKALVDYAQSRSNLVGVGDLPIRTVFDVGANVGKMSRRYRRLFPRAMVYCFEPLPVCYQKLNCWARRQQGKVAAFNLALGSRPGQMTIYYNPNFSPSSSLLPPSEAELREGGRRIPLPVRVETLDRVAARLNVQDEILVKIDTEGFDMEVIQGGRGIIERASAVILEARTYEAPSDRPGFADYLRTMADFGYMYRGNLRQAYVQGRICCADAVFIKPPNARRLAA
jgi:FkbM family methyltransferase